MSSHAQAHPDRNVIHLDLSSQKLLLKPDDPIPEFYPPPRAVMVTPIYSDADAYGQQPPGAGGSERGYRSLRDSGRRYYDDEDDEYDRWRRLRSEGRRGVASSPSYRGRYSDDGYGYDYNDRGGGYREDQDELGDRKRSRVPGTEPPLLPPPDLSHYPGGFAAGSGSGGYRHTHGQGHGHGHGHGHRHGRAQSHSYGRYDRDYGRHDRPHRQAHTPRTGRPRDAYDNSSGSGRRERGGREGYRDHEDYPPTGDFGYDSDEYYPDNRYPHDDKSYISYTGGAGRGGYAKRSRPEGTEPPQLPPPDISGYPGGSGGGGSHGAQGVPGVHEGAGPPLGSGASGSGGHGYAGSQHPAGQHPASQQGHGYAASQYSQHQQQQQQRHPPRQGKKPGLIGRIFSRSTATHTNARPSAGGMGRQGVYPHPGAHPG